MKSWNEFLDQESRQDYFVSLMQKVDEAYATGTVYPSREEMFSCFDLCSYEDVKVVIIGQDPYHGAGQAHGLSFSVKPGIKVPPSLRNIYKELKTDLDIDAPNHGYLTSWAKQGVLMMNTNWSVTEGKAGSHKSFGWKKFTQRVLEVLNDYDKPIVFILWGNHAIDAAKGVTNPKHFLLKGIHPSPLAGGGFFGSKPFSQTNNFLEEVGRGAIDWRIMDEEQPQHSTTKSNSKKQEVIPSFKKRWENRPKIETSKIDPYSDVILAKTEGETISFIELDGKQVLVTKDNNKLEFLDPNSLNVVAKSIKLGTTKENVSNLKIMQVDNSWYVVYGLYKGDSNSHLIVYNLSQRKSHTLLETDKWLLHIDVCEVDGISYAFVVNSDQKESNHLTKYNLHTFEKEIEFDIPTTDFSSEFLMFRNSTQIILLVKNRLTQNARHLNNIFIDTSTGTQIGKPIEVDNVCGETIVNIDNTHSILVVATLNRELLLFDIILGQQMHNILVDEDPKYTIAFHHSLTAYKSKLIVSSWNESKVFDLKEPNKAPKAFRLKDGSPLKFNNGVVKITQYQNRDVVIFTDCREKDTNGDSFGRPGMFDLETLNEVENIFIPNNEYIYELNNIHPYTTPKGEELFFGKHILWNPNGCIQPQEAGRNYKLLTSAVINQTEVCIAYTTNNEIILFDNNTGKEIKKSEPLTWDTVRDIKVCELGGEQQLLILANNKLQGYNLLNLLPTNIKIDDMLGYLDFDIYKGKIIAGSDSNIHIWNLDDLSTPVKFDVKHEDECDVTAIAKVTVLNIHGQEQLFISNYESSTYLYNPETNTVREFNIDNTMWHVDEDDPDFCMYEAAVVNIDGKEKIVAASHHGAIITFDAKTLKRKGRIMQVQREYDSNFLHILCINDICYLITFDENNIKVWDLETNKKLKEFKFDETITTITTCDNNIIIAYGENLQAIEVII